MKNQVGATLPKETSTMTANEYLYYGFGQLIYCLAFSDGKVQGEERRTLESIVKKSLERNPASDIQVAQIIFQLLDREEMYSVDEMMEQGFKNMHLGDHYLTSDMVVTFHKTLIDVAEAFPPTTPQEKEVIKQFENKFIN